MKERVQTLQHELDESHFHTTPYRMKAPSTAPSTASSAFGSISKPDELKTAHETQRVETANLVPLLAVYVLLVLFSPLMDRPQLITQSHPLRSEPNSVREKAAELCVKPSKALMRAVLHSSNLCRG